MIKFLIESSICLGLFYMVYWFFLRREKLLSINRFYLLGAVLVSVTIPLLEISFVSSSPSNLQLVQIAPIIDSVSTFEAQKSVKGPSILSLVYLSGVVISFIVLLVRLVVTWRRLSKYEFKNEEGIRLIEVEGYQAYSFWNTIVLGKEIERNPDLKTKVLSHELSHIRGKHSLDIFILELLKCLYWFNPVIYFLTSSLKIQHEYIADEKVLKEVSSQEYERSLATIALGRIDHQLVHAFAKLPLNRRLKMIYTTNSNIMNKFRLLIVLPVMALLVFQFSCTEDPLEQMVETQPELTAVLKSVTLGYHYDDGKVAHENSKVVAGVVMNVNQDLAEGVTVKANSSGNSTTTDKDGRFRLVMTEADAEILLSHPSMGNGSLNFGDPDEEIEIPVDMVIEIPDDSMEGLDMGQIEKIMSELHAESRTGFGELVEKEIPVRRIQELKTKLDQSVNADESLREYEEFLAKRRKPVVEKMVTGKSTMKKRN